MSCYMSDDEGLALPRVSELSSPIGGTVNVLDMINQDVMFGNSCQGAKSNANTQVTYVREAPSSAFTGDLLPPLVPMTAIESCVKPSQAYVPPTPSSHGGKTMIKNKYKPAYNSNASKSKRASTNPFIINPFVSNQSQSLLNPFAATADDSEKDRNVTKKSTSSSKKSKGKSSHKRTRQSSSKSTKKMSRSAPKTKDPTAIVQTQKSRITPTCSGGGISTVTHTVTRTTTNAIMRTTKIAAESKVASSSLTVAVTSADVCLVTATTAAVTANTMTLVGTSGAGVTTITTSTSTCHTGTKGRAPVNIISPLRNTYFPTSILYSTPTIITRTPSAVASVEEKTCEQYSILPAPATKEVGGRPRTRLVIPITLNAFATTVTTTTTTTTASTGCRRRPMHAVRPSHSPTSSLAAAGRQTAHKSFALPPGATLYAAKKQAKTSRPAVTSEPQTFAIVDSKGTYTTLTIGPDLASASASRWNRIQVTTAATTSVVSNASSVATEAAARPRSQLLIPIANSQMNTNTSLGYLVTSPIAPPASTTTASPTTTIASHTITTISSEALSKIRNRLLYNVPAVSSGMTTLPSSTISGEGGRSRGPVTIISNQLLSGVGRGDSAATPASPAPRPVSRVVIPLMSNVHAACTTGLSTKSTQGTYIIAGINSAAVTKDAVTRPSRVVIPILHNTSGAVASTSTTAASAGSKPSPASGTCTRRTSADPYSKLRSRLTIQVTNSDSTASTTTSPITAYTITRSRTPQNVYTIPGGSTPYMSVTKSSELARNPATMALITFSPPGARGASGAASPSKSANDSPALADTNATTTTTTTIASAVNRFVLKIGTSTSSGGAASTVTSSVTAPVTTAVVSPTEHRFAEPQPISSRLRTFPGPRTYSLAKRTAAAATATAPQRTPARTATPRIKKVITTPAPLQIFADVVCPPASQAQTPAGTTSPALKPRFTLTQSAGTSTLVVPKYKNTVFKNLTTVAHLNPERLSSRLAGPRASSERFVLNRSVAFVSPRRAPASRAAGPAPAAAGAAAPAPARPARSAHPDTRSHSARATDGTPASNATTNTNVTSV